MGFGILGDVGLSSSTSSGAGGSRFGNTTITDESGGGLPAYAKLALILGGLVLAVLVMRRLFK